MPRQVSDSATPAGSVARRESESGSRGTWQGDAESLYYTYICYLGIGGELVGRWAYAYECTCMMGARV